MNNPKFPELGFYTLPGHVFSPTDIFEEVSDAERLGLGSTWISERLNTKDIGVLSGAAIAKAPKMAVASGLICNLPLRNVLVTASYAATSSFLSGNRFALGVGRGTDSLSHATGTQHPTKKYVEDYVDILRRLWAGEAVTYEGPVGNFQGITLGMSVEKPIPILMGAVGFKNCEWAGKFADGVLLNTFWSKEATEKGVKIVRESAERAGRDPASIKVWSILATACDVSEEIELRYIIRRLNTYLFFPRQWEATCKVNNWDTAIADKLAKALREIDGERSKGTIGDENTSRELDDIRRMRDLWPAEWVEMSTATGNAEHCARCVQDRFDAGADGVVFHASAPKYLESLLGVWERIRSKDKFANISVTPGM